MVLCAQHLREVQGRSPYWSEQAVHMVRRRNCPLMTEGPVGLLPGDSDLSVEEIVVDRTQSSYCSLEIFSFQPCASLNDSKNCSCKSSGRRRIEQQRFDLDYGSMSALKGCLSCKDNALQACLS